MGQQMYLPGSIVDSLPAMVRNAVAKLSAEGQEEFLEEYRRKSKSLPIAYLWWFFLGAHYAYLRSWGWQIVFWLTLGGLFLWWAFDLLHMYWKVKSLNRDIAIDVMRTLKMVSG